MDSGHYHRGTVHYMLLHKVPVSQKRCPQWLKKLRREGNEVFWGRSQWQAEPQRKEVQDLDCWTGGENRRQRQMVGWLRQANHSSGSEPLSFPTTFSPLSLHLPLRMLAYELEGEHKIES